MSSLRVVLVIIAAACVQPAPFTVQLSVDNGDDPVIRRCLAGSDGQIPRFTDDEPFVAADPQRPGGAVAIWQTRSGVGAAIQWAHSTDDGRSWTRPKAAVISGCAGGPLPTASRTSDPWVTIGPDGRWYLSAIVFEPGQDADALNALVAVTSADSGATWGPAVAIASSSTPTISHDNLALTADPTRPGTAYATTTLIEEPAGGPYNGRLGFSRTQDGGRTWEPLRALTPSVAGERIGAPQTVVDPRSGRVFAVYHGRHQGQARLGVRISNDHGATWGPETIAVPHVRGARVHHPDEATRFVLADDIVQAAISPVDSRLVVAYSDAHRTGGGRYDVSVVWSADGLTWSAPLLVSDPAQGTSWLPAVAIGADGTVGVTFFSTDFAAAPAQRRARVWLRRFTPIADGFASRNPELLDDAPLAWPGDYQSVTALRRGFLAAYGHRTDIKIAFAR